MEDEHFHQLAQGWKGEMSVGREDDRKKKRLSEMRWCERNCGG